MSYIECVSDSDDDISYFDLQAAYNQVNDKKNKLLTVNKELIKRLKVNEKELKDIRLDRQLLEQSKNEKLVMIRTNKQFEAD